MTGNLHEQFERPEAPLPSDRSTGLVFAGVAFVVAYFWRTDATVLTVALLAAFALVSISLLSPAILRPLNIVWMRFAVLLSRIMNPIVMLILFAVVIVPAGLIMQLVRDPLRRRRNAEDTYWLPVHSSARTTQSSMKNQF
jgi:hypothetical protein